MSLCREVRDEMIVRDPSLQNNTALDCRATYQQDKPPAIKITIGVAECLTRRRGYQGSQWNILTQWVGPLVGFLLPALAFVISIPRPMRIPRREEDFGASKIKAIPWLLLALVLMLFDILFWIITVFAFAGPLIAGSIHEALIDHAVINYAIEALPEDLQGALIAIAFTLVGSLKPDKGRLREKVTAHITNSPYALHKLLSLLALLPSYGARVGVPIAFYLGAYAYALVEAKSKLGDNDTAHSVAFGLWYGVVVIVAIVSSSVLGVDNPASLEAIFSENITMPTLVAGGDQIAAEENSEPTSAQELSVFSASLTAGSPGNSNVSTPVTGDNQPAPGHEDDHSYNPGQEEPLIPIPSPRRIESRIYHIHDSIFRPVWIWSRARVFQHWARDYPLDISLVKQINSSTLRWKSGILASVLVSLPCAGACYISHQTPSIGFGCRSVAHLIYATSQILLIGGWWMYYSSSHRIQQRNDPTTRRWNWISVPVYALSAVAIVAAVISSIAGTIMQLVGVFKNCICKAGMQYILQSARIGGAGEIMLSNDTQAHRDHAVNWMVVGSIGIGGMGLMCVVGWMWQVRVRKRCKDLLEAIGRL
ncbi:hypothetical protein P154DRAFT_534778 [Amniculicola lignicola CBS 123094]|uniref:Uncharacterized protein n=1 Tax=Amniculicola lignicola CBS 123094 TaxID=1392246 RepID=A0A6A5WEX9_9PLEO|nr:hypothetical protein P154DRAFT_534778 [Amniculicola lignicola CBS 123094]